MTREEKIEALKRKGCYYKWKVNCKDKKQHPAHSAKEREERMEDLLNDDDTTSNMIDESFCWSETPEGHNYWSDIAFELEEEENGRVEIED